MCVLNGFGCCKVWENTLKKSQTTEDCNARAHRETDTLTQMHVFLPSFFLLKRQTEKKKHTKSKQIEKKKTKVYCVLLFL